MGLATLNRLAETRLAGGLGIKDANDIVRAAEKSPAGVADLKKILAIYGSADVFTPKGLERFRERLARLEQRYPPPDVDLLLTRRTHAALVQSFYALRFAFGRPLEYRPGGRSFLEVPLGRSHGLPLNGSSYYALVQNNPGDNPNRARDFYLKVVSPPPTVPAYYGPFDLIQNPAMAGPARSPAAGAA